MADSESTVVYVFPDTAGELWFWHVKADNGEIVVASKCGEPGVDGALMQLHNLVDALWSDLEPEYFEDTVSEWRWRLKDSDDVVVGRSSEGFSSRFFAEQNFELASEMLRRQIDVESKTSADAASR